MQSYVLVLWKIQYVQRIHRSNDIHSKIFVQIQNSPNPVSPTPSKKKKKEERIEIATVIMLYNCRGHWPIMAATFMALHIAADAKGFATAGMCASEGLLARMAVRMDAQAGWSRECLVTCPAHISVIVLRICCRRRLREVMMMLPGGIGGRNRRSRITGGRGVWLRLRWWWWRWWRRRLRFHGRTAVAAQAGRGRRVRRRA